jgi:hypothetical protein
MFGGRALKNTFTRRYTREEFDTVSAELIEILSNHMANVAIPLFYKNKETFGDIDIICCLGTSPNGEIFNMRMDEFIQEMFSPNEIFHNGNCWSFDYKEVQVDLITVAPEHFHSNQMYLSYNDLGNFIGRIAHKFGLKYGQEGLWYEHKFKGSYIGTIPISKDYPRIYNFFDLDFSKWEEGFDELEDVFEFVGTSKYFSSEIFQMDQLNKINRDRNAKRASYMSFLDWIANQPERTYDFLDKESYVKEIDKAFPEANLIGEIRRLEYEYCKKLYINSKFNGKMIIDEFGLQGKELGDAISNFKNDIPAILGVSFDDFIISSTKEVILREFKEYIDE